MDKHLSHVDSEGRARMVDVSPKPRVRRTARARGRIDLAPETVALVRANGLAKGDVLAVAKIAGIMAAKRTPELIPLCHTLLLSKVAVDFELDEARSCVLITTTVRCTGQTGVEMEALTAASVAALTIYDMAKALEKTMIISNLRLLEKQGGKSGDWKRQAI